ncbi:MAG: Mur ligase domain-containing protein, partial [Psittacicella sp.]
MDKINSFFNIKIKLNQKLNDLQINSKDIKPYDVFIALDGSNTSGKNYIDEALSFGASLIIVNSSKALDKLIEYKNTSAVLYIHNLENILGKLCASFYDYPFRKIKVIGVTGTNGKTTTAY